MDERGKKGREKRKIETQREVSGESQESTEHINFQKEKLHFNNNCLFLFTIISLIGRKRGKLDRRDARA